MTELTPTPTAAVIIIGNEILSGQTQDTNLAFISKYLNTLGILVEECHVIADAENAIVQTVNDCRRRHTYVFTTGGIGPTHDDITSYAVAKAFDRKILLNEEAVKRIFSVIPKRGDEDSRMRMAYMPEGAILVDNPESRAPGFQIENVFVLAGVPTIMQAMLMGLSSRLQKGKTRHSKALFCIAFESQIANELRAIQESFPDVEIGSYPTWHITKERGVKIVFKSYDLDQLFTVEKEFITMTQRLGFDAEEIEL